MCIKNCRKILLFLQDPSVSGKWDAVKSRFKNFDDLQMPIFRCSEPEGVGSHYFFIYDRIVLIKTRQYRKAQYIT